MDTTVPDRGIKETFTMMIYHIYWGTSGNSGLYLDEIYRCLEKAGYEQKIFVSYYYPFDYGEKIFFRRSDIEHCKHNGITRRVMQLYEIMVSLVRILAAARKDKPQVVNYSLISGSYSFIIYFFRQLKRHSGCRLVVTCHDVIPFGGHQQGSPEMKNRKRIFDMADYLLVHNENSEEDLLRVFSVPKDKVVRHLFPVMDLTKLVSVGQVDKEYDFLFIGHLRKEKGVELLLKSWTSFHNICPEATLCVCGRPQNKSFDIGRFNGQNIIFHLDYLDDEQYCHYIQAARYVVLPYLMGTNSGIISTVLSLGANVITSNIPMFQTNELVAREDMFEGGNQASLMNLLQEKYKKKESVMSNERLTQYRMQFKSEVDAVYSQIAASSKTNWGGQKWITHNCDLRVLRLAFKERRVAA